MGYCLMKEEVQKEKTVREGQLILGRAEVEQMQLSTRIDSDLHR